MKWYCIYINDIKRALSVRKLFFRWERISYHQMNNIAQFAINTAKAPRATAEIACVAEAPFGLGVSACLDLKAYLSSLDGWCAPSSALVLVGLPVWVKVGSSLFLSSLSSVFSASDSSPAPVFALESSTFLVSSPFLVSFFSASTPASACFFSSVDFSASGASACFFCPWLLSV